MTRRFLFATAFGITLVLQADPQLTGNATDIAQMAAALENRADSVTIAGFAEYSSAATNAIVTLKVSTEDRAFRAALERNTQMRQEATRTLIARGINPNRIQTEQFSSIPETGTFSGKVRNYRVVNQLRVTIGSEADLRWVADLVDSREEITFDGLVPDFGDTTANATQGLELAIKDYEQKKRLLEERFGISLVPRRISTQVPELERVSVNGPVAGRLIQPSAVGVPTSSYKEVAAVETGFGSRRQTCVIEVELSIRPAGADSH